MAYVPDSPSGCIEGSISALRVSIIGGVVIGSGVIAAQISGNTAGATSLVSTGTLTLAGGNNVTLSQNNGNIITINADAGIQSLSANGISIAASAVSLDIEGGSNISLATASAANALTVTINQTGSYVNGLGISSSTAGGVTQGTTSTASGNILLAAGSNITLSSSAGVITIYGASGGAGGAAGTNTISASGTSIAGTALSLAIAGGNNISLQTATGAGSMTVSVSGLNALSASTYASSTGTMTLTAGAGITITTGGSIISLIGNTTAAQTAQPVWLSGSSIAGGGFNGATATASASTLSLIAGSGITLSQNSSNAITISGNTTAAQTQQPMWLSGSSIAGGAFNGATAAASASTFSIIAGSGITISQNSSNAITISGNTTAAPAYGTNTISASGTSIAGTALSLALAAGANITLQTATAAGSMTISISGPSPSAAALSVSATSAAGGSITNGGNSQFTTLQLIAGSNIGISQNGQSLTFSASGGGAAAATISMTENMDYQQIGGPIASASGTVTGSLGFGSSLFLQRIWIPGVMNLTEVDLALAMSFAATSNGAGTLSQSFVLYSFGNSSSLASVVSISGTSSWNTGTSTAVASASLSQFQGGWSVPQILPFTFASSTIPAGEYVVGNLLNFAQASSTWTIELLGPLGSITNSTTVSMGTSFGTATANAISLTQTTAQKLLSSSTSAVTRTMFSAGPTGLTDITGLTLSTQSIVPQYLTVPNLVYIGTGSTTSALPSVFIAGIMSTGAIPTAITLTSSAVTFSGTVAGAQPYFALVGS